MSKKTYFFNVLKHQKEKIMENDDQHRFSVKYLLSGKLLANESLRKNLPFILFIALLFVVYIYNSYRGDKKRFAIEKIKKHILLLKSENIAAKTRLISVTKYSEAMKKAQKVGLKPLEQIPQKIYIPVQPIIKKDVNDETAK